ncbi:DNA-directed RNA polymerase II, putative [Trypanosoma equiperdum]|uniref:DNA-directed RNA polymerase II, putative n=4 Tax=Trypanozoon TaxID=39700 RepID=Q386T9_TRYB2|nr:DNA-directed RNA polymerase II, putative [Trypanosoma brucei gambiense DAL972]XP_828304.1 DNA-directed RNA polymerase II, putative [Trypanosoma brucei brucei TREU927]RHW68049.1 DNA-directed RNA polymerase II [Trypanosoma brucei equiperdum]SCU72915.1 DNA-directed RNA polymerase II, putative [Trypanosoma equiperdum]EAN79192.1 DNA-directed RNA polymerase II, putative [Trypanosoma brucei brucei TREU927]CBH17123.1 DNA-directed RNA polymerase II, putative [Trypanosoma brucei gambiense DAL972]|eukprot:XP_011779387.1 DNA-directed RNA polymerase II, putative [Trypanosoma brucei gambiense DAL972]
MSTSHGMLIYNNDITADSLLDTKDCRKIVEEVSSKMPNSSLFKLDREDHTLANLLRMRLHENPLVHIAGYRVPHPTQHRVELRVQTSSDGTGKPIPTPKEALLEAVGSCMKDLEEFEGAFLREAQSKGLDVE